MKVFRDYIRMFLIVAIVIGFSGLGSIQLMKIQVVEGESYTNMLENQKKITQTLNTTRGEIVDINGKKIIENKVGYIVLVEKAFFPSDNEKSRANEILRDVVNILTKYGHEWKETLPITKEAPYEFLPNYEREVEILKEKLNVNTYATAENCIDKMIEDYKIDDSYTEMEKRILCGLNYEMILRDFSMQNRFTLAEDISLEAVTEIKERRLEFSGVEIAEQAIREIAQGDVLPHAIGTVGPIYAEEYVELKEQGYALNDSIGKSGIEAAMEEYLRGTKGVNEITLQDGIVDSSEVTTQPIAGNTIKLTIDSEFQKKVQKVLEDYIAEIRQMPNFRNATSGAIAVLDVKTGAVLALATAPTYDLNDYVTDYSSVLNADGTPLLNRATDASYRPGSTFKPITSIAGLNEGIINSGSRIQCTGVINYKGTTVGCMNHYAHGNINVTQAIYYSCNIFYYTIGERMGIDKITEYAQAFGLGVPTNMEIPTKTGFLATPETVENYGMDWTPGLVLQAAIGQSEIGVSPLQMAVEACTLANKGVRYRPHLVDSIYSYNMDEMVEKIEPVIENKLEYADPYMFDYIEEGMIGVSGAINNSKYKLNGYNFDVAIKTGTPQSSRGEDSAAIGYAPAGKGVEPEIAFACFLESGYLSKHMVKGVIDAYYGYDE